MRTRMRNQGSGFGRRLALGLGAFTLLCGLLLLGGWEPPGGQAGPAVKEVEVQRLTAAAETASQLERTLEAADYGQARRLARRVRELLAGALSVKELQARP